MNIIRKSVKELILVPVQIMRGVEDAIDDVIDGPKPPKKRE